MNDTGLKLRQFAHALNCQTEKRITRVPEGDWLDNFEDEEGYVDPSMPPRPRLRIEYPNKMCVDLLPHIVNGTLQKDHWVLPADPAAWTRRPQVISTHEMTKRMKALGCKVRLLED